MDTLTSTPATVQWLRKTCVIVHGTSVGVSNGDSKTVAKQHNLQLQSRWIQLENWRKNTLKSIQFNSMNLSKLSLEAESISFSPPPGVPYHEFHAAPARPPVLPPLGWASRTPWLEPSTRSDTPRSSAAAETPRRSCGAADGALRAVFIQKNREKHMKKTWMLVKKREKTLMLMKNDGKPQMFYKNNNKSAHIPTRYPCGSFWACEQLQVV